MQTLAQLEKTWEQVCSQLIILSAGLSAMKFRSDEQIVSQLRQYADKIQEAMASDFLSKFKYSGASNH
ncbi:hypothetical protein ACFL2Q_15535 [Thermodesulfobacteriota bacterium]